ncbi:hypothetical protein GCM10029992_07800 [Glycomyces albus]
MRRGNGAEIDWNGLRLLTNHDGSQDDGDKANDEVLLDFFAPFAGPDLSGVSGETRLIAINEGRLVDLLEKHPERFEALRDQVELGLTGVATDDEIAVVNLNRRSLLTEADGPDTSVFSRMLGAMTDQSNWDACGDARSPKSAMPATTP